MGALLVSVSEKCFWWFQLSTKLLAEQLQQFLVLRSRFGSCAVPQMSSGSYKAFRFPGALLLIIIPHSTKRAQTLVAVWPWPQETPRYWRFVAMPSLGSTWLAIYDMQCGQPVSFPYLHNQQTFSAYGRLDSLFWASQWLSKWAAPSLAEDLVGLCRCLFGKGSPPFISCPSTLRGSHTRLRELRLRTGVWGILYWLPTTNIFQWRLNSSPTPTRPMNRLHQLRWDTSCSCQVVHKRRCLRAGPTNDHANRLTSSSKAVASQSTVCLSSWWFWKVPFSSLQGIRRWGCKKSMRHGHHSALCSLESSTAVPVSRAEGSGSCTSRHSHRVLNGSCSPSQHHPRSAFISHELSLPSGVI